MSHPKNETNELLQYLRPHEIAELEMLATPPKDANGCVIFLTADGDYEAETQDGIAKYLSKNGYMPPAPVLCVKFDPPPPSGFAGI